MSGPIVRKYGFPNFEKIFGERDLKHGAEPESGSPSADPAKPDPAKPDASAESTKDTTDRPKP